MAVKTIKTKQAAVQTIRTLDKSANLAKRAKNAVIKTKDRAEETQQARESSPNEYATAKAEQAAQRAGSRAVQILKNRGLRNPIKKVQENFNNAKSHFEEVRKLSPAEQRKIAAEAEKVAKTAQNTANKFQEIADDANKVATEAWQTVQGAKETLTEVRRDGRQTLREVKIKVKTEKARLKEVKTSERREIKEKIKVERQRTRESQRQEIKNKTYNDELVMGKSVEKTDIKADVRTNDLPNDISRETEPPRPVQMTGETAKRRFRVKRNNNDSAPFKKILRQNHNKNFEIREMPNNTDTQNLKFDKVFDEFNTMPKGKVDKIPEIPERCANPTRKPAVETANAPKAEVMSKGTYNQPKDLPHSGEAHSVVKLAKNVSNPVSGTEKTISGIRTDQIAGNTSHSTHSTTNAQHIRHNVNTVTTTAKTPKTAKEKAKNTVKAAQKSVKEAKRTVKTSEKTAKTAVREAQRAAKNTERTAKAAAKAAKTAAKAAKVAAKEAVKAAKAAAHAVKMIVQAAVEAAQGLVALIAAGGWVAALIILIVCLAGLLAGSVFGIFFSNDTSVTNGAKTLNAVILEIDSEYNTQIDTIVSENPHDLLDMSDTGINWREVLAVYAAKTASDLSNPLEVVTMNDEKEDILRSVFWAMNEIAFSSETSDLEEEILDESGLPTGETEIISKTVLKISTTRKTPIEAATFFEFSSNQTALIEELLKADYASLWNSLLYGFLTVGNGSIVEVAASQVGNVGGEIYWRWYGFASHEEWCACFVSWCAEQSGLIESGIIPKFSLCTDGVNWFKNRLQWQNTGVTPNIGDIIFFDWDSDGTSDHVGIVERAENGVVFTIEGNSGDVVINSKIMGYGLPLYLNN